MFLKNRIKLFNDVMPPSSMKNTITGWIAGKFSIDIHPEASDLPEGAVLHVAFYEAPANFEIACRLLESPPRFSMGFKMTFYGMLLYLYRAIAGGGSDDEMFPEKIDDNFRGIISLTSETLFKNTYIYSEPDPLQIIIDRQKETGQTVTLVPHIIFWNRSPVRSGGTDTCGNRGLISAVFCMLKSATRPLFKVIRPLNPADFENAQELLNELMNVYEQEKKLVLGPLILPRHEIRRKILYHPSVVTTIRSLGEGSSARETELRKQSLSYFREIAADFSIIYVKYFALALEKLYRRIYEKIEYDREEIFAVMRQNPDATPVFVPNHKSMMDFMIISSIFYKEGIIPPHIVAGLNMNFFPMGKLFRKSGGFFMRRSFRENPLYASVFRRYVMFLIHQRYSFEFFIEGGRSRSGRQLRAKIGILKYISEALEEIPDMKAVFIPVSVNYDRIFEERSFAKEISGAGEKPESSSEFARARRQMKKRHGRVYLSFGTPVDYRSLMNNCGGNLGAAAEHIAAEVNRGMKVSLSAFTSLAAMSREGTGFYYNDLLGFADTLKSYMDSEKIPGGEIFSSGTDSSEILRSGLKMFADSGLLSEEGSGDDIFYIMKPGFRQRIFYYRNTIAHHFALPACAAAGLLAALRESGRASKAESDKLISKTAVLLEAEFPGFNIDTDNLERVLNFFKEAGLLAEDDSGFHVKDAGAETLKLLSNIARDIIESHFIVLTAGSSFGDAPYNEENLINECRAGGTRLYHMGYLRCDEALSVMQYKNIVASYTRHGVISATDDNEGLLKTNDTPVQEWKGLVSELLTTMDRAPRTLPEPVRIKV